MQTSIFQNLAQEQVLTQKQLISLKLLTLNNYELNKLLQQEEMENPLLEISAAPHDTTNVSSSASDSFHEHMHIETRKSNAEEVDIFYFIADTDYSNYDLFLTQLDLNLLNDNQLIIIKNLIDLMDDSGYIRYDINELSSIINGGKPEISYCLNLIRGLQPYGVGAYDLAQCLSLQLKSCGLWNTTLETILNSYLPELSCHKYTNIAHALNISREEAIRYAKIIRSLNPRPLNGLTKGPRSYIIPDILFYKENSHWAVALNDSWMGTITLNDYYLNMNTSYLDNASKKYLTTHKNRALFIKHCIDQRRITLLRLSNYILMYQIAYLETGKDLKPLTLKQIADSLDLHESTISRAIKDKYVQTPSGTYLLKEFLPASLKTNTHAGDDDVSSSSIKKILLEIISLENKSAPYNDNQLSQLLCIKGINISRRTVAKYRGELNIPTALQRKYM